jgi:hypothetical protein
MLVGALGSGSGWFCTGLAEVGGGAEGFRSADEGADFFATGITGRWIASTLAWSAATASDNDFVAACSDVRS